MGPLDIWEALGGRGEPPKYLGASRGPLLVLGGARCVWDDFGRVRPWGGEIMAVNDIGQHLHCDLKHWVTLHPEYMRGWRFFRERHGYPRGTIYHSTRDKEGVDVIWPLEQRGGSSGLFAVHIGLMMGYDPVVLAGIPMDGSGHYFDPPWQDKSEFGKPDAIVWHESIRRIFCGRVKSLSGRTRDWLGEPGQPLLKAAA